MRRKIIYYTFTFCDVQNVQYLSTAIQFKVTTSTKYNILSISANTNTRNQPLSPLKLIFPIIEQVNGKSLEPFHIIVEG